MRGEGLLRAEEGVGEETEGVGQRHRRRVFAEGGKARRRRHGQEPKGSCQLGLVHDDSRMTRFAG